MNEKTNIYHIRIITYLLEHGSFKHKKEVMKEGKTNTKFYTDAIEDLITLHEIKRGKDGIIEFEDKWKLILEKSPNLKKILLQNKDKLLTIMKGTQLDDNQKTNFDVVGRINKNIDITTLKNKDLLDEVVDANRKSFQSIHNAIKRSEIKKKTKEKTKKNMLHHLGK